MKGLGLLQFLTKFIILFSFLDFDCLADISNFRKCANELCTEKISQGRTTQRYFGREKHVLSFAIDENVDIYSKEAGTNNNLWGVEINGKKGFINKKFVVEEKVFKKDDQLTHVVPIISTDKNGNKIKKKLSSENESKQDTNPNTVNQMFANVLDDGKIIDHVPELSLDVQNLEKSESITSDAQELDPNNVIGGNTEPLSTNPTLPVELVGVANDQSVNSIIENSKPNNDQKQHEFLGGNAIRGSSEMVQEKNEIVSEEILFKDLPQNFEKIEPEIESILKSDAPSGPIHVSSDEIRGKSIGDESADDGGVLSKKDDSVLIDDDKESSIAKNVVDDNDNGPIDDDGDDDDEEMDNEDEGNGNEGEENGKEMDIKLNIGSDDESANNLKMKDDLTHKDVVANLADELTTVSSNIIPIAKTINNSDSDSLPEPTPSRNYEVFEGTTLFVDDVHENSGDVEVSSASVDVSSPSLSLQASQVTNKNQESHATPLYETTQMPFLTTEGLNVLNKGKVSLPDELANSNEISEEQQVSSLTLDAKDANIKLISVLSMDVNDVTSDIIDNQNQIKNSQGEVDMVTNFDKTIQAIKPTESHFTNSEVENPLSSEAESTDKNIDNNIPESSYEVEFVSPKPESVLAEYDTVTDKPLDEPENKGFFASFFNNIGSSQDASLESDTLEIQSTESTTEGDGKQSEKVNKTESIDIPFSDPYKDASTESIEVLEMQSDGQQQDTHSEDPVIEAELAVEASSFSDIIFGIPQNLLGEGFSMAIEEEVSHPHLSKRSMMLLVILAAVIVISYIAHSIIIKTSREAPLLDAMNKLDKQQRLVIEENNNLKRIMTSSSNGQVKSSGSNIYDHIEFVNLKDELSATKSNLEIELHQLKQHNLQLEKDLENSTANEEELNRMISELLSNQNDTENFAELVNGLQATLDDQKEKVESLTADLAHKSRLNDELRAELRSVKERSSQMEYQIEQLSKFLEDMKLSKEDAIKRLSEEENNVVYLRDVNNSIKEEAEAIKKKSLDDKADALKLKETVKDLKKKLNSKIAECKVSKECFKRLQLCSDGGNNNKGILAEIFKIVEVKTKLELAEKERLESEAQLVKESEELESINKVMVELQMQSNELQEKLATAEIERDDSKAKLNILTQVYEEKFTQLKSQLESQEELRQDAEGSAADITSRVQSYKLELQSYKDQVLSLKQELENQQQSYKLQLANEEKKLNDTWLSARNAERRQEELRQENTQLRQKLTQMHKESDQNMLLKNSIKRGETNGSLSSPIPGENDFDGIHSPPASLPMDFDGSLPPMPPMFMPHHHLHPGHPPPHLAPPPPHLGPPHPGFLPPFMGPPPPHLPPPLHLPPPHPDRRLPPAGRIASPPGYDRRSYSPASDYSDHRYSPSPRYSPGSGNRNRSPDRRSDRSRHSNVNSSRRKDHASPDRWYTRSPQRFKLRQSPNRYFNHDDDLDESKGSLIHAGKKTSTPLGPNDR